MTDIKKFSDRYEAGDLLAEKLIEYVNDEDTVVLALTHGGVPVGIELAKKLNLFMDVLIIRKLFINKEGGISIGAVGPEDLYLLNEDVIAHHKVEDELVEQLIVKAKKEIGKLEGLYQYNKPYYNIKDKKVILVDEGAITGASIKVALELIMLYSPAEIIVALPIAPLEVCKELKDQVKRLVCLKTPYKVKSLSNWYQDFPIISDSEIQNFLDFKPMPLNY